MAAGDKRVRKTVPKVPPDIQMEKRCACTDEQRKECEHEDYECVFCPCDDFTVSKPSIQCPDCFIWYHYECVGLKGLVKEEADRMENWKCYVCWASSSPISPDNNVPLKDVVKKEILNVLPEIVKTVVTETSKSKDFTSHWSALFKDNQVKVNEQTQKAVEASMSTAIKRNQDEIVERANAKQDADNFEREKRSRNIVIKGLKESKKASKEEQNKSDRSKVAALCDLSLIHI